MYDRIFGKYKYTYKDKIKVIYIVIVRELYFRFIEFKNESIKDIGVSDFEG